MEPAAPSADDCLRLLRGERDEQKLAGLLLATKSFQAADPSSLVEVYRAVGPRFLRRLLTTGMGKGVSPAKVGNEQEAYLKLAVTVLATFARVPEIASSEGMISSVPLVVETVSKSPDQSIVEECYEFLSLVAASSKDGTSKFYEPGLMDLLAEDISSLHNNSRFLELAIRLLQSLVNELTVDMLNTENVQGISSVVVSLARLFGTMHNAIKFDALHMLTALLSLEVSSIHDALRSMLSRIWAAYVRVGIKTILQNRVVPSEKLQALLLAECMMSILGKNWLLEQYKLPEEQDPMPVDKFVLLVLESARIEAAVLLNELAQLKYEPSNSFSTEAAIKEKQRNLAISFSLLEKIIKMISDGSVAEGSLKESTLIKFIAGLNETIGLVLDFLQDSKDHGQTKGDDLLASVRIIGSYLAEAPQACKEKTRELLEYILSVEGEDESSPFYSICFMLPMLCQITSEVDGCRTLAYFGGHKTIADCLAKMIEQNGMVFEDSGIIFLACDTILNFLTDRKNLQVPLESQFVHLLRALVAWAGHTNNPSVVMMASSICTLILDLTSEESLLCHSDFGSQDLATVSQLITRGLNQETSEDVQEHVDEHQIIIAGFQRWAGRFPSVRNAVRHAVNI